jgi:hypothetical protein
VADRIQFAYRPQTTVCGRKKERPWGAVPDDPGAYDALAAELLEREK